MSNLIIPSLRSEVLPIIGSMRKLKYKVVLASLLILVVVVFTNCVPTNKPVGGASSNTSTGSNKFKLPVPTGSPAALYRDNAFGEIPLRRLTRAEIRNSLLDVIGIDASAVNGLPEDVVDEAINVFENESSLQSISSTVISGYERFAEQYAALVLANRTAVDRIAGCVPARVDDQACFQMFARKAGRLLLRRTITTAELTRFSVLLTRATAMSNYYVAPSLMVQVFIQHPEFLYRFESGTELTNYEIASRMSYLLWGSAPDNALMNAADAGLLKDEMEREREARRMLTDARARKQWKSFHSQWLGYANVVLPANLSAAMTQETDKLIDYIGFDSNADWMDLFTHDETWATPALSQHYALSGGNTTGWVPYTNDRGGGILSHARFLAQGSKFGDTSPTLRGYRILKRVLCVKLGPVPVGIDPDNPPAGAPGSCKAQTYNMRTQPACMGCHEPMDGIGFGLENYSPTGQWRATEPSRSSCNISGNGKLLGDAFNGSRALGERLAKHPETVSCAARQLFRFTTGRADTTSDSATISAMAAQYGQTPEFKSMLLSLVKTPGFIHR